MKYLIILYLLFSNSISYSQDVCNSKVRFKSYAEALYIIENSNYVFKDYVNTYRSSFINGAQYYSCNRNTGFLIIQIRYSKYVHCNVPYNIWIGFKGASSFGSYYNKFIRNRFRLILN
jgi:hypothetical protein